MSIRLGIIGGGNMGHAIVRGAIEAGVLGGQQVVVAEIDPARRGILDETGCRTTGDPADALVADQLMLAVKPQSFPEVAAALGELAEAKVVISIMAGIGSTVVRGRLGPRARVVRVMPNLACQVGAGMAAVALGEGAEPGDEALAVALFDALGRTAMVDEALMHAVTAVSGSGPAYVFLLAEAMGKAAVGLGLDAETAELLVRQTVLGAARLLDESDEDAAALRRTVTSPGGTTEAAVAVMKERNLVAIVVDAVTAARDRGVELDR